jgi:hypothetical protein
MSEVLEDRVARLEQRLASIEKHLAMEGRLALVEARLLRLEVRREVAADMARLDAKIDALSQCLRGAP